MTSAHPATAQDFLRPGETRTYAGVVGDDQLPITAFHAPACVGLIDELSRVWFEHSRGDGDLGPLANKVGYSKADARFVVSMDPSGWIKIVNVNGRISEQGDQPRLPITGF